MFANVEDNFYQLYKDEKESIIVLKECEIEDDDNKSVASFESEDFDDDVDEDDENTKKAKDRRDSSESKASTEDEDFAKIQYKISKNKEF